MAVDLGCDKMGPILKTFTRCLAALPNLRTLEVISMGVQYSRPLQNALDGIKLPQIRTLSLPSAAHHLLLHCPNVDDLTCIPFRPDQEFVDILSTSRLRLRRFATLVPVNPIAWGGERCHRHPECTIDGSPFRAGSTFP